jgi:hypothetical protein
MQKVIHSYTRKNIIEDGFLIEVPAELARQAVFSVSRSEFSSKFDPIASLGRTKTTNAKYRKTKQVGCGIYSASFV